MLNFDATDHSRSAIFRSCIGVICGGACLVMSLTARAAGELRTGDTISVRPFTAQPSLDITPVDIRFDGELLRIPRNYLETARLSKANGRSAAIVIVTTFPEFAGAKPDTIDLFRIAGVRDNAIKIYPLGSKAQVAQIYQRNAPAIAAAMNSANPKHDELIKVSAKTSLVPQDVYVGYGGHSMKPIVISCAREETRTPLLDCNVYFEIRGLPFLYRYEAGLLRHWRTIDKNILGLLNSFFAGGGAQ